MDRGVVVSPAKQVAQAYLLAVAVIVAGVAQVAVQLPTLRRLGYHFDYNWSAAREGVKQIGRNMAPMFVGLAVTQINTFVDSLIAWGLAAVPDGPQTISWLGDAVQYPMQQGAVAAALLWRPALRVPAGHRGHAGGGGHLSAVEPPCRPRRPSAIGRRHDARPAVGALLERAGRSRD